MKRSFVFFLCLACVCALLTGCGFRRSEPKKTVEQTLEDIEAEMAAQQAQIREQALEDVKQAVEAAKQALDESPSESPDAQAGNVSGSVQDAMAEPALAEAPAPQAENASPLEERLMQFFEAWARRSVPDMLACCSPVWRDRQPHPEQVLAGIALESAPADYALENVDGGEGDVSRAASVKAHFCDPDGEVTYKRVQVRMQKVDNEWYVDPFSLYAAVIDEEPRPASDSPSDAPTAAPAASAGGVLVYYNPDGGKYYHGKANCPDVNQKYWPLEDIPYEMLNSQQYKALLRCPNPECGAPERPPLQ